jgi:hypothetical protein
MDDFDWYYFVHKGSPCSNSDWFMWHGGGGSLSNITVECPQCQRRSINLGLAYDQSWQCSGRSPEREPRSSAPIRLGCGKDAKIIQRQASNLRIPELKTLFSIPPRLTSLHGNLQIRPVLDNIIGSRPSSKQQFHSILNNLVQNHRLSKSTADEILKESWDEIYRAMQDVLSPIPGSYHELILEEFNALENASIHGAPPVSGPTPRSPVIFHVDPNLVQRYNGPLGSVFRITPILKLRTIIVQEGYRREVDTGTGPHRRRHPA